MVDAVLNTLFLQRQQQVMRDMEMSERELSNLGSSVSPTSSKQIKRYAADGCERDLYFPYRSHNFYDSNKFIIVSELTRYISFMKAI